jgi:hypothetical protein
VGGLMLFPAAGAEFAKVEVADASFLPGATGE